MPPQGDVSCVDVFVDLVLRDLKKLPYHRGTTNCTQGELMALSKMEKDCNIVIKPSVKGGNIVILDSDKYRELCEGLLSDKECYRILPSDPTDLFVTELKNILSQVKTFKLIDTTEFEFLLPKSPRLSTFYSRPKVHKGLQPLKGRPIVSGIDNLCQNVGTYIDTILKPFVETLPSFV